MTHDDKRYGATTRFAAMDAATGRVISLCQQRHRHQEWRKFLRLIDDEAPPQDKQIHLIADNYATQKHAKVQRWLKRHPRFHVHFTPASAPWLRNSSRLSTDMSTTTTPSPSPSSGQRELRTSWQKSCGHRTR